MTLPISVIIPTMNRPESLERTLSYIAKSANLPQEVIIIDQSQREDVQTDNKEIVTKFDSVIPYVAYIYQQKPSLTMARNCGIAHATQDILVFSDDDVDVQENTFLNIYNLMKNKTISMIGGICDAAPLKNSILGQFFFMSSYRKRKMGHVTLGTYGRFPTSCGEQTPTEWAMGFFFAVRRTLLKKWNIRFDENLQYYAYAEDLDFSYSYYLHSKEENLRCIMSNKLLVKHNVSTEYRIPSYKATAMVVLHREYIRHKYHQSIAYKLANTWTNIGMLMFRVLKREKPADLIRALRFLGKYYDDVIKGNFHYEEFM